MTIRNRLAKYYTNFRGWSTKRKFVVFESDDWGSIRMPSRQVYDKLKEFGFNLDTHDKCFDIDSLESKADMEAMYEVLCSVKDKNGNPAVYTPLTIVANPDFEKIEAGGRKEYVCESLTETYNRYYGAGNGMMELWREGIERNIFYPQFHGREHLNARRYIEALNSGIPQEELAFKERAFVDTAIAGWKNCDVNYFEAFGFDNPEHEQELNDIVADGLNRFERLFGFRSVSFCPPCGVAGNSLCGALSENGVKYMECGQQFLPQSDGTIRVQNRMWGALNEFGQIYWRRNCKFDPIHDYNIDWADRCLEEIRIAFRMHKPAVISSHRVNFIGTIKPENRDINLPKLATLLRRIVEIWPDVEFVNSEQLAQHISETIK